MTAFPGLLGRPDPDPRRHALISLAGGRLATGAPTTDPGAGACCAARKRNGGAGKRRASATARG